MCPSAFFTDAHSTGFKIVIPVMFLLKHSKIRYVLHHYENPPQLCLIEFAVRQNALQGRKIVFLALKLTPIGSLRMWKSVIKYGLSNFQISFAKSSESVF